MVEWGRKTGNISVEILNAPDLHIGLELYWVAFCELGTCRPPAMAGAAPIPWTAIEQWSDKEELDEEQNQRLHLLLGRMDKAYSEWAEKDGSKSKPPSPGTKDGGIRRASRR